MSCSLCYDAGKITSATRIANMIIAPITTLSKKFIAKSSASTSAYSTFSHMCWCAQLNHNNQTVQMTRVLHVICKQNSSNFHNCANAPYVVKILTKCQFSYISYKISYCPTLYHLQRNSSSYRSVLLHSQLITTFLYVPNGYNTGLTPGEPTQDVSTSTSHTNQSIFVQTTAEKTMCQSVNNVSTCV